MRIRAYLGAALAAACMLAFAPAAMAEPAPDICVVNLTQPSLELVSAIPAEMPCDLAVANVDLVLPSMGGGEGVAALPSCGVQPHKLDYTAYRIHPDPGRCV